MCQTGGGKLSEQGLSWLGRKTGGGVRGGGQTDGEGEGNAEAASGGDGRMTNLWTVLYFTLGITLTGLMLVLFQAAVSG